MMRIWAGTRCKGVWPPLCTEYLLSDTEVLFMVLHLDPYKDPFTTQRKGY